MERPARRGHSAAAFRFDRVVDRYRVMAVPAEDFVRDVYLRYFDGISNLAGLSLLETAIGQVMFAMFGNGSVEAPEPPGV